MNVPRVIASNIGFTESPLWTSDGRLLVTSVSRGLIYEVSLDGADPMVVAETGGGPNGICEGVEGEIWITQNGGSVIASRSTRAVRPGIQCLRGGEVVDVVTTGLDAPNDCVIGPDQRLWFTDPGSPHGPTPPGRVLAMDIGTLDIEVISWERAFPNALAFSPVDGLLYFAETKASRISRIVPTEDGIWTTESWSELPAGEPDGIAFDAAGNLYVTVTATDTPEIVSSRPTRGASSESTCRTAPCLRALVSLETAFARWWSRSHAVAACWRSSDNDQVCCSGRPSRRAELGRASSPLV